VADVKFWATKIYFGVKILVVASLLFGRRKKVPYQSALVDWYDTFVWGTKVSYQPVAAAAAADGLRKWPTGRPFSASPLQWRCRLCRHPLTKCWPMTTFFFFYLFITFVILNIKATTCSGRLKWKLLKVAFIWRRCSGARDHRFLRDTVKNHRFTANLWFALRSRWEANPRAREAPKFALPEAN